MIPPFPDKKREHEKFGLACLRANDMEIMSEHEANGYLGIGQSLMGMFSYNRKSQNNTNTSHIHYDHFAFLPCDMPRWVFHFLLKRNSIMQKLVVEP